MELEWVHGYRGFDCRNNIFFANSDKSNPEDRWIVFYAAALGIVMNCTTDPNKKVQKYFRGHSDDIKAIALNHSADSVLAATGQEGMGKTYVWDVYSLQTLAAINTKQKSINMISFSGGEGRLLITISDDKSVVVSEWKSQTILVNCKGEPANTFGIAISISKTGDLSFVSCGDKHIRFWTLNGRNLNATKVTTSKVMKTPNQFLCIVELLSFFFVGSEDGYIYIIPPDGKAIEQKPYFSQYVTQQEREAMMKTVAVTAMHSDVSLNMLITGSKGGNITLHSVHISSDKTVGITKLFSFELDQVSLKLQNIPIKILAKQIQSLYSTQFSKDKVSLVIGTRGCDILNLEIDYPLKTNSNLKGVVLIRSHCNDELWGVATHPTEPQYCSVGDDKTLRFYDLHSRTMIGDVISLGNISRTVAYSPNGDLVALG